MMILRTTLAGAEDTSYDITAWQDGSDTMEYPGQLSTLVRPTEFFILVSSPPLELTLYYVYNHTIHLAISLCRQGYRQHPESSLVER